MLRYIFTIAFRNLRKDRGYTLINVLGLAVGLAAFILIALYVKDEWSYDQHHSKHQRIYRLWSVLDAEGQGERSSSMPFPVGPTLAAEQEHLIEECVRLFNAQEPFLTLQLDDKKFNETGVFFVDSNYFKVFDHHFVAGDPQTALRGPNKVVLTQSMATKYFGSAEAIGKELRLEGNISLKVTAVVADPPAQSHFLPTALVSFTTLKAIMGPNIQANNWVWNPNWTYVLLKEGVQPEELETHFPAFIKAHMPDFMQGRSTFFLMPLANIHLDSHLEYEIMANHHRKDVEVFLLIGFFILLIACINYMNLATARSMRRAKEVGIKKVLGSTRNQLIGQFLAESILVSALSVILGVILVELLLIPFNHLSGKTITTMHLLQDENLVLYAFLAVGVGVLAGAYPAFFLSRFKPVKVLKAGGRGKASGAWVRKALVGLQFTAAIGLMICTVLVHQQFEFLRSQPMGFNDQEVLVIPTKPKLVASFNVFKERTKAIPGVENVTKMNDVLGVKHNVHEYNYEGMDPGDYIYFPSLIVDEDFIPTFGMELVAGRNFGLDHPKDDSLAVIINETMVRELGWKSPQQALGKQFFTPHGTERVVGVVKDFHFVNLSEPIRPFVLDMIKSGFGAFFTKFAAVRIQSSNAEETINQMEQLWTELLPEYPFEYYFLDAQIDNAYKSQSRLRDLMGIFALLAIFISCVGLFALSAFTIEQKTKELAVRKILGASNFQLVLVVALEFLRMVLIAILVAVPIAYVVMRDWLNGYAEHIPLGWMSFVIAALVGLLIALLTVSFQAVRAGTINPINALRYE